MQDGRLEYPAKEKVMELIIQFDCNNAAFIDNGPVTEAASILRKLAQRLEEKFDDSTFGEAAILVQDSNGNSIGSLTVHEDDWET